MTTKSTCPLCGGTVLYQGLNTLECETPSCENFNTSTAKTLPAMPKVLMPDDIDWDFGTLGPFPLSFP